MKRISTFRELFVLGLLILLLGLFAAYVFHELKATGIIE